MMIVWKTDEPASSTVFAHYQIIRRNGAVVPFEPSRIAEAMKAFLAVHGTLTDRERRKILCQGLIFSFFERVTDWRCQIRLLALDFKRAMLVQGAHAQGNAGTVAPLGANVGRGFFSAAKPNLRNAP